MGAVTTLAFYLMRLGSRVSNGAVPSLASNADARLLILVDGPRCQIARRSGYSHSICERHIPTCVFVVVVVVVFVSVAVVVVVICDSLPGADCLEKRQQTLILQVLLVLDAVTVWLGYEPTSPTSAVQEEDGVVVLCGWLGLRLILALQRMHARRGTLAMSQPVHPGRVVVSKGKISVVMTETKLIWLGRCFSGCSHQMGTSRATCALPPKVVSLPCDRHSQADDPLIVVPHGQGRRGSVLRSTESSVAAADCPSRVGLTGSGSTLTVPFHHSQGQGRAGQGICIPADKATGPCHALPCPALGNGDWRHPMGAHRSPWDPARPGDSRLEGGADWLRGSRPFPRSCPSANPGLALA